MSDIVYYNVKDMEQNGIKLLCDEHKTIYAFDFSEHDKEFEDKIAKLESEISYLRNTVVQYKEDCVKLEKELESKENIIEVRVPASPIEIATHLINNTCTINELKMIAEYLLVYCKHNKGDGE